MKKLTLLFVLTVLSSFVFAEENDNPFSVHVGGALTVESGDNLNADGDEELANAFNALLNMFKAGVYVDGLYNINEFIAAGVELGFYTFPNEDGEATALIDLPVLAIVEGNLFDILRVKGHFGYTFSTHLDLEAESGLEYVNKFDIGARAYMGGLYLDYSMLFWADSKSSVKWGLGFEMPIL